MLLPLGVALVIKLLPPEVWHDAQRQAAAAVRQNRATVWLATGVIALLWLGLAVAAVVLLRRVR